MVNLKKDQRAGKGCVITLFSISVLLPTLLGLLALIGTDYQRMMLEFYIIVFPLAWVSFLTSYYQPLNGGVLLIVTGLITIAGPPITIENTPGLDLDAVYLIPLALFIGLVLIASGALFIKYRHVR